MSAPNVPDDFTVSLWAADPLVANPVVFWPDQSGRVFVCESYRQETKGVPDNRAYQYWTEDDLRCMTVDDRAEMYLRHHPEYAEEWTREEERIMLLEDRNHDGFADHSQVFADGFNEMLDGTGAGVLVRQKADGGSEAWYACIPHLWKLEDRDGDGVAEQRTSLHRGYGVRVALRGHDMHGLQIGPDGMLYFSIGDRGYAVETTEGEVLSNPGSGAVFRCNLDGSGLELFCVGLRNPQELCFDDYGNLWTGDNNCDAGDRARIVYLMEGGDCGWRMNYQYLPDRGPWMPESWWKPEHEGQPAFLNPPIANLTSGPSGIACYPGTGLPASFRGSFFIADFLGTPDGSGIRRFTMEPDGAGFNMNFDEKFIWKTLATDVDFMPNGNIMVADWVEGWTGVGKGRLWLVASNDAEARASGDETAALLGSFHSQNDIDDLVELLAHQDRRIRLAAQFKLVELNAGSALTQLAMNNTVAKVETRRPQLARIHAIWGLVQLGLAANLLPLLESETDDKVRAQLAKAMGENAVDAARQQLLILLGDSFPRVRYFAAMSLGKLGRNDVSANALLTLADENANDDRFIRHAVVWALAQTTTALELAALAAPASAIDGRRLGRPIRSASIRLAAVLALRLQGSPEIVAFLTDPDKFIATEAAIAIYDLPIEPALGKLADTINRPDISRSHRRRAIHACFLVGRNHHAQALVDYSNSGTVGDSLREEAVEILHNWNQSDGFDRLHNTWRPHLPRENPTWATGRELPLAKAEIENSFARGRKVFFENPAASCQRCHWIEGQSGGEAPSEVGPELSSIGLMLANKELRASITDPAASIAPGFEIRGQDGEVLALSAMTPVLDKMLKAEEIDDLVTYLASLKRPKKILVHVYSAGFEHGVAKLRDGSSLVERSWEKWAAEDQRFEIVSDRSPERFTAAGLAGFDAVFLYTTGELPWPQGGKQALLDFVANGGALIGSHCASDTFYDWPEFGELLGGWFDGHPWHEKVGVNVEDNNHLSTLHLGEHFEIIDEIYQFKNWDRSDKRVLLSLDTTSVDMQRAGIKRDDGDFGISWTRRHGKGRIFYTGLGHRPEVWRSQLFRDHLVGGTIWATRK